MPQYAGQLPGIPGEIAETLGQLLYDKIRPIVEVCYHCTHPAFKASSKGGFFNSMTFHVYYNAEDIDIEIRKPHLSKAINCHNIPYSDPELIPKALHHLQEFIDEVRHIRAISSVETSDL
jgi:hypothetical protein